MDAKTVGFDPEYKKAQTILIRLGFDCGPSGADGFHGRFTQAAIEAYQRARSIPVKSFGVLDAATIQLLNAERAHPASDTAPTGDSAISLDLIPPHVAEARRRIGLQEVRDNRSLSEYLASDGSFLGDPSRNPWCGDFLQTVIALSLPREPMVTNPFWALNWQAFGTAVVPDSLVPLGAIVTLPRHDPTTGKLIGGHVGIIVGQDANNFHVLGGNESNMVTIVPIAKDRRQGKLRYPRTLEMPKKMLPMTALNVTVSVNEA